MTEEKSDKVLWLVVEVTEDGCCGFEYTEPRGIYESDTEANEGMEEMKRRTPSIKFEIEEWIANREYGRIVIDEE